MTSVTTSRLDRVRSSLSRLEQSESPPAIKSAGRLIRRVGRSFLVPIRKVRHALNPRIVKRNVLFPIRNILLRRRPITVAVGGQSFLLAPEGAVPLEMWSGHYFERHELELILTLLQPNMTFVDVGANVGLFSIPAAKKLQHGRVLAFEPCSWTYQRLLQNMRLNNTTNLLPVHTAVGDRAGEALLQVNAAGKDGLNTLGKPIHSDSQVVAAEKVPIGSLDALLLQHDISHVDVMKVDVEGAELFVFRGAIRLLNAQNAPLILYESSLLSKGFDYHPIEQMWLLEKCGYSFFVIDSDTGRISVPPGGRAYGQNVIAVKPSHPLHAAILERVR